WNMPLAAGNMRRRGKSPPFGKSGRKGGQPANQLICIRRAARLIIKPSRNRRSTMVIVLFRSKLMANAGSAYADTLAEMEEYVKTRPGFIAAKGFTAEDGERLTVVWWQDKETLAAWQHDMRHLEVKQAGR